MFHLVNINMKTFSERIKELRREKKLSQVKMAENLDLPPATYQYYEDGGEAPYAVLRKLTSFFNVSADYLIGNTDIPDPYN